MPTDLFNNPSNDYINPGLAPCSGAADDYAFEFLPKKEAGVINGSQILQSIDLGDISIPITAWISEKKYIAPGEVIYIPGLTKGLELKSQRFVIPIADSKTDQEFFMQLDLSINYYYNFRYYNIAVNSSSNYTLSEDINNNININFGSRNINVSSTSDVSAFTFSGGTDGYEFNITNAYLTIIDASLDINSPFATVIDGSTGVRIPQTYTLVEDTSSAIPSAKYPNGGMLGYILKALYPTTSTETDRWFYMNNVRSPFISYSTTDGSIYTRYSKTIDVGMNGAGTTIVMSAADYLDYINSNDLWDKVGDLRAHITALDLEGSSVKNLIGGFYVFNPHDFGLKVEYMIINY